MNITTLIENKSGGKEELNTDVFGNIKMQLLAIKNTITSTNPKLLHQ